MTVRPLALIVLLCLGLAVHAADTPIEFPQPEQQQRFQDLIEELRCLVCQNQSLADSHADLAQDLRLEIYQMIIAGKTDQDIIDFMVERYGDFILYRPPVKRTTILLWLAPFVLLLLALMLMIYFIRGRSLDKEQALSQEEKEKLSRLLANDKTED